MHPSPCAALLSPCRPMGTAQLRGTTRTRNSTRGKRQTATARVTVPGAARRGAARSALRTLTLSISASSAEYLVRSDARSRGFFLPSAPSTSAPGLGSPPRPHRHRDWAQPCPHLRHDSGSRLPTICTGTALTVGFTVGATVDVINDLLLIRVAAFFGIGRGNVAA